MPHLLYRHGPLYGDHSLSGDNGLSGDQDSLGDQLDAASSFLAPAPPKPVVDFPYTGDYRIDTLLLGVDQATPGSAPGGLAALQYRWNAAAPLGTAVQVTFSFMTAKPIYGGTDDGLGDVGFSQFTGAEKTAVREIMAQLQTELGIQLVEVSDSATKYGQIRLGNNFQTVSAGYTWLPSSTGDDRGGDVWIDQSLASGPIAPGSFAWATLVHEIGHSLGLKHPGDYNAGSAPTTEAGNFLGALEDNTNYTVMSYRDVAGGQERDWYGMYDLLTLKTLYGSGTPNAGNDTYTKSNSDGNVLEIIDDSGGFDTLDVSAVTRAVKVDLHPGGFSSVGFNGAAAAVDNLSISLSTVIEKFVGTSFGDTVMGNDAANQFFLGGGANVADGAGGIDMALYAGARSAYQVTISGATVQVSGGSASVSDALVNVERLGFSDHDVALDLAGAAGITAKVLGAVFGASYVTQRPDYAGIGLSLLDGGMSYDALVQLALDARLGVNASHAGVVELLYSNVVGSAPDSQVLALFTGWLDTGAYTAAQLGIFAAETTQNLVHIDWVGLAAHGLDYV